MQPLHFGKKYSTRDLIIRILGEEPALSVKKLHERVQKESGQNITYQAIHKCVLQLLSEGILEKNGANFQLNKKWLEEIKKFGDSVSLKNSFESQLSAGKKIMCFTYTCFSDWGRALAHDFFVKCPNPGNKPSVCCLLHTWSVIGASDHEFETVKKVFSDTKHYSVTQKNTFLDQYFAELLNKMGKICKTGIDFFPYELFVQGDFVAQVYYPPEWWEKISVYYNSVTRIEEFDITKILEIYSAPFNIQVMIFENCALADFLRNRVLKEFE